MVSYKVLKLMLTTEDDSRCGSHTSEERGVGWGKVCGCVCHFCLKGCYQMILVKMAKFALCCQIYIEIRIMSQLKSAFKTRNYNVG